MEGDLGGSSFESSAERTNVKRVWVLAEQREGVTSSAVLELLTLARSVADEVVAFSWGRQVAELAGEVGDYGAGRLVDLGDLDGSLPGPRVAAALAAEIEAGRSPDALLVPTSYDGRDIGARLSARADLPVITNVVGISVEDDALISEHAVFGGAEVVRARFTGAGPGIFVVRPKSFVAERSGGAPAEVVQLEAPSPGSTDAAKVVERHVEEREGPNLEEATVVVSGGRGLGSPENYALVTELARLLHGAPGASRAIVDAGWVPYSHQVGQTGKTVKPDVYIACGISGATQHLVGMKGAKHIIAINKDAAAPILQVADLGVVGDVTGVLPRLIEALRSR
jgi:electron transfer flavoprotein alpha subunit